MFGLWQPFSPDSMALLSNKKTQGRALRHNWDKSVVYRNCKSENSQDYPQKLNESVRS